MTGNEIVDQSGESGIDLIEKLLILLLLSLDAIRNGLRLNNGRLSNYFLDLPLNFGNPDRLAGPELLDLLLVLTFQLKLIHLPRSNQLDLLLPGDLALQQLLLNKRFLHLDGPPRGLNCSVALLLLLFSLLLSHCPLNILQLQRCL